MDSTPVPSEPNPPDSLHRIVINFEDSEGTLHTWERFDLPKPDQTAYDGKRFSWRLDRTNPHFSFLRITSVHKTYEQDLDGFRLVMRNRGWLYLGSKTLAERDAQPRA